MTTTGRTGPSRLLTPPPTPGRHPPRRRRRARTPPRCAARATRGRCPCRRRSRRARPRPRSARGSRSRGRTHRAARRTRAGGVAAGRDLLEGAQGVDHEDPLLGLRRALRMVARSWRPGTARHPSSVSTTTRANNSGSSGSSKNSTVPFSRRMWKKLSTFASGWRLISSATSLSSRPSSASISLVTRSPPPATWTDSTWWSPSERAASVDPPPRSRTTICFRCPAWSGRRGPPSPPRRPRSPPRRRRSAAEPRTAAHLGGHLLHRSATGAHHGGEQHGVLQGDLLGEAPADLLWHERVDGQEVLDRHLGRGPAPSCRPSSRGRRRSSRRCSCRSRRWRPRAGAPAPTRPSSRRRPRRPPR